MPRTRAGATPRRSLTLVALVAMVAAVLIAAIPSPALADECPAGGDHDWQATIERPATEDEDGLWLFTCTKCGETFTKPIPATGHLWSDWIVEIEPTCTSEGREYRVCTRYPDNPHYEYRIIPMLSPTGQHDWQETSRVDATCTDAGSITYTCSYCGETYVEALPALGHDWGDWQLTTPPTATEPGVETRVCKRDSSHVETREVAVTGEVTPATPQTPASGSSGETDGSEPEADSDATADADQGFQLISKDFFTAGPGTADAVMAGIDLTALAIFAATSAGLLAQWIWIRSRRKDAHDQACGKKDGGDQA